MVWGLFFIGIWFTIELWPWVKLFGGWNNFILFGTTDGKGSEAKPGDKKNRNSTIQEQSQKSTETLVSDNNNKRIVVVWNLF